MEQIGSLFLVLALALLVIVFLARPFIEGVKGSKKAAAARSAEEEREHQRSSLLAERDRVLNALQELDFDYALGKVPAEDYPEMRAALLRTGADALRQLDGFDQANAAATAAVEDRIEAAVAARRADAARLIDGDRQKAEPEMAAAGSMPANGKRHRTDEIEELVASRKRERKESTGGFCPRCGKPSQKSDRFCSKCGATL